MSEHVPDDYLYRWLLTLARDGFAAGHVEPAFQALTAAYHVACRLGDPERLTRVARTAEEHLAWIDTHASTSPYSTATARANGQPSDYSTLAQQAHKRARLLHGGPSQNSP